MGACYENDGKGLRGRAMEKPLGEAVGACNVRTMRRGSAGVQDQDEEGQWGRAMEEP